MPKTLNASENSRTSAGNAAPLIGAHKINSLKTFKTNSIVRGAWVRIVDLRLIKSTLAGGFDPAAAGGGYRPASVLVVIYGSEPRVIMTEKPRSLKIHAGEISFPGGKREGRDRDPLDTALRETAEEIGLAVRREQVIGQLASVTTLNSGFVISPFVAVLDDIPTLSANPEVQEILRIPLEPFLKTMADDPAREHRLLEGMYTFEHGGRIIWGASARILRQIALRVA